MLENAVRTARQENARLRKDIKTLEKLPPEQNKRMWSLLRRARAKDKADRKAHSARAEKRSGAIPGRLWEALMLRPHPDGHASTAVRERAFREMKEREPILRAKAT